MTIPKTTPAVPTQPVPTQPVPAQPVTTGANSIFRSAAGVAAVAACYGDLLDSWPLPADRVVVPTRLGDTFVLASGPVDAPPVVALQGSGANIARWLSQIATLAARHRVYAVDVIGEPGWSAPSRPPLGTDAYACWLDDVLVGLGLSRVALVGESLGGWFALDYAIRRPDRVGALVVLNPSGIGRRRVGVLVKSIAFRPFGERGLHATFKAAVGPLPARAAGDPPMDPRQAELAFLIFRQFRHRREPIPLFDDTSLRALRMPVLAIIGGRDPMVDAPQTRARLLAAVPGATVRLIPNAGHLLPVQAATIVHFLIDPDSVETR